MGMYTELIFGAAIKSDIGYPELAVLEHLFGDEDEPDDLPKHEFFTCDRWRWITKGTSYYFGMHHPHSYIGRDSISGEWVCSSRANIKNYGGEIEKFLDWIKPFIRSGSGDRNFYAVVCYEESEKPVIHYLEEASNES